MMDMTEEQRGLFEALTKLQRAVALVKVANPAMPDVEAYVKGGGKSKTYDTQRCAASEIFANPNVKAFTNSFKVERVSNAIMSREEMAERLTSIARTAVTDIVEISDDDVELMNTETGEIVKNTKVRLRHPNDMPPGALEAISELTVGKDGVTVKLKAADQRAAMKQLAELQGFDAAKQVEVKVTEVTDDDLIDQLKDMGLDVN